MQRLHRFAEAVASAGALVGGLLLLAAAVIIGIDIVLRYTISKSIGGADELSGYALAIATAWGLSFTLLHRAHIRIDSLYELFSQSIASKARSISALATPLVIPQVLWFAGFVFLMLVLLLLLVQALAAWKRGDLRGVARLIGSKAVIEEVQEEMQQAEPQLGGKGGSS
jgi:TRAP-type mannitol/chloroaromatic compound transport system permease small subunit